MPFTRRDFLGGAAALAATPVVQQNIVWTPFFQQSRFIAAGPIFEVFYGGARGGGKTEAILGEWISHQDMYGEYAQGIVFRKTLVQLEPLMNRAKIMFGRLTAKPRWNEQKKTFFFPNGAILRFAYLERDKDAEGYQGHEYTRVYVEELTNFESPIPIMKLMATLRSSNKVNGVPIPCGFRATGNPGGPGHSWVKERYISSAPPWTVRKFVYVNPFLPDGHIHQKIEKDRVFIPSKVSDNKHIPPDYPAQLMMQGSPTLVRAWLAGDWNIIEGAFFPEFNSEIHVIPPFQIPAHWSRFRAADWGSAKPFSVGWYAVVSHDFQLARSSIMPTWTLGQPYQPGLLSPFTDTITLPRGALVRYREWYGTSGNSEHGWNQGLKMNAEAVAEQIVRRELDEPRGVDGRIGLQYGVMDPSTNQVNGGPSILERMNNILTKAMTAPFIEADNKKTAYWGPINGNDQLRARLVGDGRRPMLYFFNTCLHAIRTLPILPHDEKNPETSDTDAEDHAPDEIRYACMSRPYIRTEADKEEMKTLANATLMDLFEANEGRANSGPRRI
jgi:hypothetical protein